MQPTFNPTTRRYEVRTPTTGKINWDAVASAVLDAQIIMRPQTRPLAELGALLASNFRVFGSGETVGIFRVEWSRVPAVSGHDFLATVERLH